ncbi:medium chain dehydrogenase/reductase family protein [Bacillus sp. 31A1R]|uniref:Medium chain dehydrogenase/reductase family protein n=1 Tax=Robertmurraya mangrovi TaxID=3098077 RepID=A0ABU5J3T5_9BACI|nr:medium chain dehydrogenase/reductase family protein [Bacillus sp. 31A1R]MDZ5474096.1 medium chain dehydrogenase/reductase family protein [Bacillus sp. 31A1R]
MLYSKVIVTKYGGPEVLEMVEGSLRPPSTGEILLKVQSAGVALADIMRREGVYPMSPQPPFTPGYDVVGMIDMIGEDVTGFNLGERVGVFFQEGVGGYAEYVYANPIQLIKIPDSIKSSHANAVLLNYVTAYQMLRRIAKVTEGETILIHGASGGVGTALLELGKLFNLNMFGTASKANHSIVSKYGAYPIDYKSEDFVEVLRHCAPNGIDVVFDPIGEENWSRSIETLSQTGRFIGYGFTSAIKEGPFDNWLKEWKVFQERVQKDKGNPIYFYSVTNLKKEKPIWYKEDCQLLMSLLEKGKIKPHIAHEIPFKDVRLSHEMIQKSVGKIILIF